MSDTTASHAHTKPALARYLPILDWLPRYQREWLSVDLLAGVTIAAFAIPEGMAYAGLAGLPPQAGLYASLLAVLGYSIFGTSRQLSIGPTSALSILVATGLAGVVLNDPARYSAMAALLAMLVGVMAIVARVLRLGFLVNFISESVLVGFSAGAALYISATQLGKLFGIEGASGEFLERISYILGHLGETNLWALGLGLVGIIALLIGEKRAPRLPWALIVVLASVLLMTFSNLANRGVEITGAIPSGLPPINIPAFTLADIQALLPTAAAVFLLSYVEGMGVARTFATKHKYPVDANQELLAVGASNLLCGIGSAFPVGGSMSRSAVNDEAGAQTPLAGAISGLLLMVVVLFFTDVFTNLPEPILAAVVLIAVKGLIDIPALRRLFQVNRSEFWIALIAMGGVLVFGMLEGVLLGTLVSLLMLVWWASNPSSVLLGRIPGTHLFSDLARHPENEVIPETLVFRTNAGLFYANVPRVKEDLLTYIGKQSPPVKLVVFDLSSSPYMDLSAVNMLRELHEALDGRGITLRVSNVTGAVRDLLRRDGLEEVFGDFGPGISVESITDDWLATHSSRELGATENSFANR